MTEKNHFQINRRLLKHPLWLEEPFTKGQAWVDLIGSANYRDGYFIKKGQRVDVKRGQSGTAMLTFALRWKWSRGKVKRFFGFLEKEGMIKQKNGHLTTITTICNYELYQLDPKADGTSGDTSNGHLTDIRRTSDGTHPKRINNNQKELKRTNNPPNPPCEFPELWDEFPELWEEPENFPVDSVLQNSFSDCKKYLGMSDQEIKEIHSVCSEPDKFAEAVKVAIEFNNNLLAKGDVVGNLAGYIRHAYQKGKTSKETREKIGKKNKKPIIYGAPDSYLKLLENRSN